MLAVKKKAVRRKKTRLSSLEVRAAAISKALCDSGRAPFSPLATKGRLRVVPHFLSGIVERAKREHA